MYVFVVLVGGSCIYFWGVWKLWISKTIASKCKHNDSVMNTIKFASMIVRKVSRFSNMFIGILVPEIKA